MWCQSSDDRNSLESKAVLQSGGKKVEKKGFPDGTTPVPDQTIRARHASNRANVPPLADTGVWLCLGAISSHTRGSY